MPAAFPVLPERLIRSLAATIVGAANSGQAKGLDAIATELQPSQTVVASQRPTLSWRVPRWMAPTGGSFEVRLKCLSKREDVHIFAFISIAGRTANYPCPLTLERGQTYEWSAVPIIDPTIGVPRVPVGTIKAKFAVLSLPQSQDHLLNDALAGNKPLPGERELGRPLARAAVLAKDGLLSDAAPLLEQARHSENTEVRKQATAFIRRLRAIRSPS